MNRSISEAAGTLCLMKSRAYRADIDGLRAIAVATILLFHAGFAAFSGGFVGVDVFFVISGFLITGQIVENIERGTFSLAEFYERRIRRLMPAALATFAITATVSYATLIPEQLVNFGASLVASLLWASNIFFWQSTGYFDLDAHAKPLLHIWSLSVEEQFYLVWPLLLLFFARRSRLAAFIAVAAVSAISLATSESGRFAPETIFYLMPFRIVEFGLGAALALPRRLPTHPAISELAVIAGLGIIAFATFNYTQNTVFPGINAVIPCLGAILVIYGGQARFAGIVLRNPASVGLGRISYSVYLVHWPIVVFHRILAPGDVSELSKYAIATASIAAGCALYRLVEVPFRHKSTHQLLVRRGAFASALAAMFVLIGGAAGSMWQQGGWEWRYPPLLREEMKVIVDADLVWGNLNRLQQPFTDAPNRKVLLVGDSQAGDFLNTILDAGADGGVEIRTEPVRGECQPVFPRSPLYYEGLKPPYNANCQGIHDRILKSGKIEKADIVVLASNWQLFGLPELNHTIEYYLSHGPKRVFVIGRKDQGLSGQSLLRMQWGYEGIEQVSSTFRSAEAVNINAMLKRDLRKATYVDLMDIVCPPANVLPGRYARAQGHFL
uniref:Acyltransferase n=1 Tax=Bosea sp. NBC_00436 TaxID=2969620 RepID=A0A9E7ZZL7_9HYPH